VSVYDYDPETGRPHEKYDQREPQVCAGCHEPITPGQEVWTTITQTRHTINVPAHADHYNAARANTLADTTWQRDQSHYAG